MVRTRAPQGYEKTITNYLAFRIRGSQKNAQLSFGPPEPGSCLLDGYSNSIRGWVVPVVYETRTGELTGRETIKITTKQYFFWFLGDTIAGITPRVELCPGLGTTVFDSPPATDVAAGVRAPATLPAPARPDTLPADVLDTPMQARGDRPQNRVKPTRSQKAGAARAAKNAGKASRAARGVAKDAGSRPSGESEPKN